VTATLTIVSLYLLAAGGCALVIAVHNEAFPPSRDRPAIHAAFGLVWWALVVCLACLVAFQYVRARWR
jgi:hypothetical protein